jgi:hypothetical protein
MTRLGIRAGAGPVAAATVATVLGAVLSLGACSLKKLALRSVADTMSGTGTVYSSDDDPELVRDAIPFALKTMEQLADALPDHFGIRVGLARTCASLAVGFFKEDAERAEDKSVALSRPMFRRAKKMALRARNYALQAFDLRAPGGREALLHGAEPQQQAVLARMQKGDVELLYWLGASWAAAISTGKDDMELVGQLPRVGRVMERALVLDESWDEGALHEFFILFDSGRGVDQGGGPKKAEAHYKRALELGQNKKLSPHVSLAETVMVDAQNKPEFKRLLKIVVDADVDKYPAYRLVNILAHRRAEWLLQRTDELFAD